MPFSRSNSRLLIGIVVVAAVIGAIWFFGVRDNSKPATTSNASAGSNKSVNSSTPLAKVETDNFNYPIPGSWSVLTPESLAKQAADSGAGLPGQAVYFTTQTNPVAPASDAELKSSTLSILQKLQNFQLISSSPVKIDGQSGLAFVYTSGATKTRSEMDVVVHNKKTFLLLSSASDASFDKYKADFATIKNGFKFK